LEGDLSAFKTASKVKSCIVLELKEGSTIFPWYLCPVNENDQLELNKAILKAYNTYVKSVPIENLPDDVDLHSEF